METTHVIAVIAEAIDVAGVVVIAAGVVIGVALFAWDLLRQAANHAMPTRGCARLWVARCCWDWSSWSPGTSSRR